jgi:hypothetical protein
LEFVRVIALMTRPDMINDDTADPSRPKKRGKRRESWSKKAERHGVSTRTLDRWVEQGIIDPPEYINGRKYAHPDVEPRTDAA